MVMTVVSPYDAFQDAEGDALELGFIYVGTALLNPLIAANRVAVYSNSALTIPVAQPIRTRGGVPVNNNGTPIKIFTANTSYSIVILDKRGRLIYSNLNFQLVQNELPSTLVRYERTAGEIAAGVTPVNYYYPPCNVRRYGAVGDIFTNDTAAVSNAILAAVQMRVPVYFPQGEYGVTGVTLNSGTFMPPFIGEDGGGPNARRVSALIYIGAANGKLVTVTGLGSAVRPVFSKMTFHGGGQAGVGIFVTDQRGGLIEDCHFEEYSFGVESCAIELRNAGPNDNVEQWTIINNNFLNYRTGIRLSNANTAVFTSHAYGYYAGNIFAAQNLTSKDLDIGGPNVIGAGGTDLGAGLIRCYWQARTHVSGSGGCHVMVRRISSVYQSAMFATGESDNGGAVPAYYRFLAQSGHGDISFTGSMDIVEAGLPAGTVMADSINTPALFLPNEIVGGGWTGASTAGRLNKISGPLSLPLQPAFSAYLAATAANATGNSVNYNLAGLTESFDQFNNFDPVTGVFTAPVTGRYTFTVALEMGGLLVGHTLAQLLLVTTGGNYRFGLCNPFTAATGGQLGMAGSITIPMTAGQTANVRVQVQGGTQVVGVTGSGATFVTTFSGNMEA